MLNFNYIEEYYKKIMSGEIVACTKIKQVYQKVMDDLKNQDEDSEWHYDNSKSEHVRLRIKSRESLDMVHTLLVS